MKLKQGVVVVVAALVAAGSYGELFGTGTNQFSINFVNIGNAGNAPQSIANRAHGVDGGDGYGAVGYNYRIGKYEVTIDQFTKAHTLDSRIGSGNEAYWNDGTRTVGTGGPASEVTLYESMKFANFLTTGDAYSGAYQFNAGGTLVAVDRDAAVTTYGTVYVLPSENEWFKAAYYNPGGDSYTLYSSGQDTIPPKGYGTGWNFIRNGYVNGAPNYMWVTGSGAQEQNGTYDMMGNVMEWTESATDGSLDNVGESRIARGGTATVLESGIRSSARTGYVPTTDHRNIGFRVAVIPEPGTIGMISLFATGLWFVRRFFPAA